MSCPVAARDMRHRLTAVAYHEAGHIIAAMAFNARCIQATIIPTKEYAGLARYRFPTAKSHNFAEAVASTAGAVAEAIFCPQCAEASPVDIQGRERSITSTYRHRNALSGAARVDVFTELLLAANNRQLRALALLLTERGELFENELGDFKAGHPIAHCPDLATLPHVGYAPIKRFRGYGR